MFANKDIHVSIKWKHFPRYWPFVRGIHRSPVNSPYKGQWRGALMFSLICAWMNGWANTREADDLLHHHAHYGVMVMLRRVANARYYSCCWGRYDYIWAMILLPPSKYCPCIIRLTLLVIPQKMTDGIDGNDVCVGAYVRTCLPKPLYRKTSNISCTLVGNKIVDHSDVVGASPVGAAPTTSSFSIRHLASRDWAKKAARQYENIFSVEIWCVLY